MSDHSGYSNRHGVASPDPSPARGRLPRQTCPAPLAGERFQADYISLLAHQLITPLSTISSSTQSMIRRAGQMSESDIRSRAEKIKRAVGRLTEIIENILAHTRATSGAMVLDVHDFDLNGMVRRVCDYHHDEHPSHPFEVAIDPLPDRYKGDPLLLEQVFIIVLSNAIKYSPVDCPIRIAGDKGDGAIAISVRDQGIGVLAEDLPHLTQPFFRGRNAKHMPGTGLGLSLASHILDLHGGSLRVESREGQGTTVSIILPTVQTFNAGGGI
ncbi:sensor histidine kinase [Microvirga pudoricolor]|uniref:sensor histidine kinase n=1 Tax=Microvirga pudoricolor TaxID=2778729 RepID=UPI0019500A52|nr:HAMP domain-containing sensor histidine kinase [Microvirga pudoricolor]MBM6592824.1 HAMP domain-containing histidine kinase [Microvirga pudoricolor]